MFQLHQRCCVLMTRVCVCVCLSFHLHALQQPAGVDLQVFGWVHTCGPAIAEPQRQSKWPKLWVRSETEGNRDTERQRDEERASVGLSITSSALHTVLETRKHTVAQWNPACLHTGWQSAKTNSSHQRQTVTLPWLEKTVHVAPEGKEEGEEKQRKTTDEKETER